jgi:hypothetical protein
MDRWTNVNAAKIELIVIEVDLGLAFCEILLSSRIKTRRVEPNATL